MKIKKILKVIWNEFIYGGHFLALGDAAALYVIGIVLKINVTWDFLLVIYLCVFAANLFNRSDESDHDALTNPIRVKVMAKYTKYFYPIVIACLAVSIALILCFANIQTLLFATLLFVLAMLYTSVFKKITKYIVGFKCFYSAFFYSLMAAFLIIYYSAPFNLAFVLIFIFYYMRIFISNAACDVKDVKSDSKRELKTLVIVLGEKNSMRLLNILNIASGLLIILGVYIGIMPMFSLALLLTIPYASYYFYLNLRMSSKEVFTNIIVDGEFIFWVLYLIIGKVIF